MIIDAAAPVETGKERAVRLGSFIKQVLGDRRFPQSRFPSRHLLFAEESCKAYAQMRCDAKYVHGRPRYSKSVCAMSISQTKRRSALGEMHSQGVEEKTTSRMRCRDCKLEVRGQGVRRQNPHLFLFPVSMRHTAWSKSGLPSERLAPLPSASRPATPKASPKPSQSSSPVPKSKDVRRLELLLAALRAPGACTIKDPKGGCFCLGARSRLPARYR